MNAVGAAVAAWTRRGGRALAFVARYGAELVRSGVRVARAVVGLGPAPAPRIVRVPLMARTDAEIAAVAHLISLTPGTLTVDVSPDRRTLLVHAMFAAEEDVEGLVRSLQETVERPFLGLVR